MNTKTQRELFTTNLQYYMSMRQKKQIDLIRDLHFTAGAVSMWYNGTRIPRPEVQTKIADYLGVTVADLNADRTNATLSSSAARIPVYAYVGAGYPHFADEDIIDYEEVSAVLLRQGEYFGLKVRGDSMEPKISSGDVLIVKKTDTAESGDIVIAMVNGDEAICKKLKLHPQGISLISTNTAYEPMFFTPEEVQQKPVRIVGICVEVRGKLK